jgi:hypothetical protein
LSFNCSREIFGRNILLFKFEKQYFWGLLRKAESQMTELYRVKYSEGIMGSGRLAETRLAEKN